ncbi:MAG: hypothetical protein Q7R79_00315, partial [bacterium]|nr:hypothetical protein [bacterium]
FRNGYVENGLSSELIWAIKDLGLFFQIAFFAAAFWLFMKFIKDLYIKIDYLDELSIIISLSNINGVTLHGFGNKNESTKWSNPYDTHRGLNSMPTAKQKNFRYERSFIASELGDKEIEEIVKEVTIRVSNAFGESIAKCFDDDGNFDKNQLRSFRNLH